MGPVFAGIAGVALVNAGRLLKSANGYTGYRVGVIVGALATFFIVSVGK